MLARGLEIVGLEEDHAADGAAFLVEHRACVHDAAARSELLERGEVGGSYLGAQLATARGVVSDEGEERHRFSRRAELTPYASGTQPPPQIERGVSSAKASGSTWIVAWSMPKRAPSTA